ESAPAPARSRVIVAGPQVVARGAHASETATERPRPVPVEPPPSTPLPPRVTPVRPAVVEQQQQQPQPRVETAKEPATPRSQFELELERARARTADKPRVIEIDMTKPSNGDTAAPPPARDPSRPAVGTVIALPPRIKITERTPVGGRPAPGPMPVNPIRDRYKNQQQQRRGPGGPGGRGPNSMMGKKLPLGKKG